MSKRKKYDPKKRVRATVRGSRIRFDGNESHAQDVRTAAGLPIYGGNPLWRYMVESPHRWRVSVEFEFTGYGLRKSVPAEFTTDQACHLNDLADTVRDAQVAAGLELGDGFKFDRKTWTAEVVG